MNYVFSQIISKVIFDMKYHRNYAIFPATLAVLKYSEFCAIIWRRKYSILTASHFPSSLTEFDVFATNKSHSIHFFLRYVTFAHQTIVTALARRDIPPIQFGGPVYVLQSLQLYFILLCVFFLTDFCSLCFIAFFEQLETMGFCVEAWTKAPYLCEGDLRQSFYWLVDVVVVLSKK